MNGKRTFWYVVTHTFAAASEVANKLVKVSSEYNFVIQKIVIKSSNADFYVRVIDNQYQWSNSKVKSGNFGGTAQYPNILLEPARIPKNVNIEIELTNGTALAANAVEIAFEGYLTKEDIVSPRRWFQYVADQTFTGASEQATKDIRISGLNNFICQKFVAVATATDYQVDIIDANLKWTQDYVTGANIFGTAQLPNIFMNPIFVVKNASITIHMINGSTAANPVQLCLEGYLEG